MYGFLPIFTLVHVAISLVAIASGFVVLYGLLQSKRLPGWTAFFLATTMLTSVTGFGFPFERIMPGHVFGVLSLIALGLAIYALYSQRLAGKWRMVYVATAIVSQYLNFFVLVVQCFLKVPALHALAPTQTELPFALAQGLTLIAFLILGTFAVRRFRLANG